MVGTSPTMAALSRAELEAVLAGVSILLLRLASQRSINIY